MKLKFRVCFKKKHFNHSFGIYYMHNVQGERFVCFELYKYYLDIGMMYDYLSDYNTMF